MLVFIQGVLPVPAGAGRCGFVAWFTDTLPGDQVARLLLEWRFYTLAVGALAGGLLLTRLGPALRAASDR